MPEKVHLKFGDGTLTPSLKTRPSTSKQQSKPAIPGLTNGVKRLRDGSPKAAASRKEFKNSRRTDISRPVKSGGSAEYRLPEKATGNGVSGKLMHGNRLGIQTSSTKPLNNGAQNPLRAKGAGVGRFAHERANSSSLRTIAARLEKARESLPIWSKRLDIRYALRVNDILLINGETGSGKSTQVPQYLCKEPWCKREKVKVEVGGKSEDVFVGGMIAITQPRRVAAITLAQRVAREMGSPLQKGAASGEVGYSVRFESVVPPGTKIKFVTEGMLLQEMLHDPNLRKYSAVIVDEIHERSVDVDLITGFLRTLLHSDKAGRGGVPLKVVIMSATLDLGGIEAFFAKPETIPKYHPGHNHGRVLLRHLKGYELGPGGPNDPRRISEDSFSSWEGFSDDQEDTAKSTSASESKVAAKAIDRESDSDIEIDYDNWEDSEDELEVGRKKNGVALEYVKGREYEVELFYKANPQPDYMQSMLEQILQLHVQEPLPGDILAFLTGQDEIETLQVELESQAEKLVKTVPKMKVMPLYGALSAQAQQDVFEKVKDPFTRKIVLATNIAETSVTVSGVRFVVDCGKSKVKQYRARLGMESLLAKPISRVSAIQRMGRAGREARGKCFRLYTENDYLKLDQDELPEILRCDVVEAVLKMKARGIEDVLAFPLMDSPNVSQMEKALVQLHMMGALDDRGKLTDAGRKMAQYPLPAAYGRVLVAAAEASPDVLLDIIDVISCLTTDSEVFLQPKSEEAQEATEEARSDIQGPQGIAGRGGDIVTLLTTMQRYASEKTDRGEWCRIRLISVRAMKMAMQIRKQLRQLCVQQKLLEELPSPDPLPFEPVTPERAEVLLKAFLKAFAIKTALLGPDGNYVTTQGRNAITIHPSSSLYGQKKFEAIMFLDHVFTAKSYAKKVSPVQANWIEEAFEL
ncbi:P-loop containing nucleoside triphosphate hydrolase protein [Acephala macrosclerotiorum]|nr:P-loop containing nucleoside triphosphate hydrolase protein [Acephala macrosclerotiorum]